MARHEAGPTLEDLDGLAAIRQGQAVEPQGDLLAAHRRVTGAHGHQRIHGGIIQEHIGFVGAQGRDNQLRGLGESWLSLSRLDRQQAL